MKMLNTYSPPDRPVSQDGLVPQCNRGMQYVSIRYTGRLAEAGVEPSVGSVGDFLRQHTDRDYQRSR